MAHVHSTKLAETAKKAAEEAACPFHAAAEAAGSGMGGMMMGEGMGKMMEGGMGRMMMGEGMTKMMQGGTAGMMEHGAGTMMMGSGAGTGMMMAPRAAAAAGAATGVAVTAARHSLLRRVVTHPLVLFGAGLAIGFLIHKYREELSGKANEAPE